MLQQCSYIPWALTTLMEKIQIIVKTYCCIVDISIRKSELFSLLLQVKAAILNLFKELCKFKRLHHISVKENDYEAQLKFIKTSYQELLKIANIAKAQEVSDEQSIMANLSFDSN